MTYVTISATTDEIALWRRLANIRGQSVSAFMRQMTNQHVAHLHKTKSLRMLPDEILDGYNDADAASPPVPPKATPKGG